MHLKPTAECQISTLVFGFGGRTLCISHEKYIKDGKVLAHLGFRLNVPSVNFNGICIGSPLPIQISKLIFDTLLWA
jgi:hypothetical protein